MGILRFYLAVCVVATHSGELFGLKWMNGLNAVVCFFIISGFYMTLILNEKYTSEKSSYSLFISNRLLRLMPIYWTVLIAHIVLCCIGFFCKDNALSLQIYFDHAKEIPLSGWMLFIFCNLFIVGMDVLNYLHLFPQQGLLFSKQGGTPAIWFMPVFQAWTLSIELLFYLIAPFILRKQNRIIATILFLLTVIIFCRFAGVDLGSFTKSQFAPYLIYFLLGAVAWIIYKQLIKANVSTNVCKLIFVFYLFCLILFPYGYPENEIQIQSFYLLSFLTIPFIFHLTKTRKWDAIIGEYSYPVYITHIMVNDLLKLFGFENTQHGEMNLFITLFFSWVLIRLVVNPVERIRKARLNE